MKSDVTEEEEEDMYLHHFNWMYETEEPVKHHLEFRCGCIDQVVFFLFVVMSFLNDSHQKLFFTFRF